MALHNGGSGGSIVLSNIAPFPDGVGDTRDSDAGSYNEASRRDHVHPIEYIQSPPAFSDVLIVGAASSNGAPTMATTYTTEETVTYRGDKPIIADIGEWTILTPPVIAGYILTDFHGEPYSDDGMGVTPGLGGGDSRNVTWHRTTYYDTVYRNGLAHYVSFKAEYRLN